MTFNNSCAPVFVFLCSAFETVPLFFAMKHRGWDLCASWVVPTLALRALNHQLSIVCSSAETVNLNFCTPGFLISFCFFSLKYKLYGVFDKSSVQLCPESPHIKSAELRSCTFAQGIRKCQCSAKLLPPLCCCTAGF